MISPSVLQFLTQLSSNNNKPWFDEHRKEYERARKDYEAFADGLRKSLVPLEPALEGQKAGESIFRIFRDVRFSKDKTPYKTAMGAFFSRGGRKFPGAGYYIHIEPGKSFAGGGLWMPEGPLLKAVRQEIDYNFDEFSSIINEKSFKKHFKGVDGEKLKTLPQGYTADNPAIEFLKLKSFTAGHAIDDTRVAQKDFLKTCTAIFTAMRPFVDFLNRSLD